MGDATVCGRGGSLSERKARLDEKTTTAGKTNHDQDVTQAFELRHTSLAEKKKMFAENAERQKKKMSSNPFSGSFKASATPRLTKDDPNYGRPVAGSKSEGRGKRAAKMVNAEVVFLCEMIRQEGVQFEDGTAVYIIRRAISDLHSYIQ
ncbi:hypothetical protein Pmani_004152 [Petrolisthes manimaculis]|uniref:Uncharacterized protein n=1 Tax=Petrolisthes manimaculis TaxID=1843537 RepID=A0AAE1QF85_9EUCA|nr:hypothetical protein Pmani_004152 [Petrolisthes manimaculis]